MDGAVAPGRTEAAELTRALAARAAALDYDALPQAARELTRQCVLDYLGVALAGARIRWCGCCSMNCSRPAARRRRASSAARLRLPTLSAALLNGAAGHALDYRRRQSRDAGPSLGRRLARAAGACRTTRQLRRAMLLPLLSPATKPPAASAGDRAGPLRRAAFIPPRRSAPSAPRPPARTSSASTRKRRRRARHRRDPSGRPQIAIRHDVQAVPRRQGGA